jgi:hypothetical protein
VSAFVNLSAVTVVSPDGVTFVCVDCSISSRGRYATYDRARMLLHLYMHQATGDSRAALGHRPGARRAPERSHLPHPAADDARRSAAPGRAGRPYQGLSLRKFA